MLTRVREQGEGSDLPITDQSRLLEQADLLERAHDVLVQALSTVDRI